MFAESSVSDLFTKFMGNEINWAPSSEFVSSSIPSWQTLTAHAQPFRGARDLAFCLKVPLDSLLVWASSGGSGETARMRRLAWTFAARIGDKYQIRLARPNCSTNQMARKPMNVNKNYILLCKHHFIGYFYKALLEKKLYPLWVSDITSCDNLTNFLGPGLQCLLKFKVDLK